MSNLSSIAIVFNGLYVGGAEKFGISIANKFVDNGFNTSIISFKETNCSLFDQIDKRIEIIFIPRKFKYDFILHNQFDNEINKRNIKKVIIIGLLPVFFSRFLSFKRNREVSYFISLHSSIPPSSKIYLLNMVCLFFTRKTDYVFFICNNQRRIWSNKYYFNPNYHDIIYNGVDVEYFKPGAVLDAIGQKESMKIEANDKIILLVASIRKEKGHINAIESLNILHTQYADKKNVHLVFVGDGDESYVAELESLVKKHSLDAYVHFEGDHKDVRKYHEIADIFTLTSYSETFSIAALEAMCYGLPLSLTNVGGASEMVINGKNGMLSKVKDPNSIAASWVVLLDGDFNKNTIREIALKNYSLELMFKKYLKTIMQ